MQNTPWDERNIEGIPGICKQCEERFGRRGNKSDMAPVRWVMVTETQGKYRYQSVCNRICHTMYTVTEVTSIL